MPKSSIISILCGPTAPKSIHVKPQQVSVVSVKSRSLRTKARGEETDYCPTKKNFFFENPSKFQSFDRPRDSWSFGATNLRENNKQGLPFYFEQHSDYRYRKYIYVHICILIDHRSKLNEASIQDEFRSKDIFTFVEIFCAN